MAIWYCKIGNLNVVDAPIGADFPMRDAVEDAFKKVTSYDCDFIFSGWGAELTEGELAVIENRLPDPSKIQDCEIERLRAELARVTAELAALKPTGPREPRNGMVICPTCTEQFAAISVDHQQELASMKRELQRIDCRWPECGDAYYCRHDTLCEMCNLRSELTEARRDAEQAKADHRAECERMVRDAARYGRAGGFTPEGPVDDDWIVKRVMGDE